MGGLQDRLGYLLRRAQVLVFREATKYLAEFDMKPIQFSILSVIAANPSLSQRNLCQALGIEPARLVLMLDELQRRGLAKRTMAPGDRRSRILSLTAKGKVQLRRMKASVDEHEARMLDKLGPDGKAELSRLLQVLCRE